MRVRDGGGGKREKAKPPSSTVRKLFPSESTFNGSTTGLLFDALCGDTRVEVGGAGPFCALFLGSRLDVLPEQSKHPTLLSTGNSCASQGDGIGGADSDMRAEGKRKESVVTEYAPAHT